MTTKLKLIDNYDAWTETIIEAKPPEFSEESLALRFAEQHALDLRYVDMWSKWLIWDGKRWAVDETRRAFDLSRAICRAASAECNSNTARNLPAQIMRRSISDSHPARLHDQDDGSGTGGRVSTLHGLS